MHLDHIQLTSFIFQNVQYFPFGDHICCPLLLNLCFSYYVLVVYVLVYS